MSRLTIAGWPLREAIDLHKLQWVLVGVEGGSTTEKRGKFGFAIFAVQLGGTQAGAAT
jgi:hypothetical protein